MRFSILSICISILSFSASAQTVTQKLQKAFTAFEKDTQLSHAISSLYVIDAKTGQAVYDKNSQVGLAPASTQKIITSVTAFELLGKGYKYKTELGYYGKFENGSVDGNLFLIAEGDPTFGSWRWEATKPENIIENFKVAIKNNKIKYFSNYIDLGVAHFVDQNIPDGWIWQDIGNYYGAGVGALNWRENQFDIILSSGSKIGDSVKVASIFPKSIHYSIFSEAKAAAKGSGDNAYVYLPLESFETLNIKGTIPVQENSFKISATIPNPREVFLTELVNSLAQAKIDFGYKDENFVGYSLKTELKRKKPSNSIYTHYSPSLDSIIYWFNKKSINLYGEALIKTFAYEKQGYGSTDSGVSIVKKFWEEKKLDKNELNIVDGSGLSPLNRVTTHAQVEILKYAKTKEWFPSFFNSLPEYNGMKIKSGTIRNVKGFCGYHTAKNGKDYIFSFLVNNYNGSASGLVNKMYKVLDLLK